MLYYHVFDEDHKIIILTQDKVLQKVTTTKYTVSWGKLFHKSLFKNIRFPRNMCHEDVFVAVKLYLQVNKIANVSSDLYCYRIRENSITSGNLTLKKIEDKIKAAEERLLDLALTQKNIDAACDDYIIVLNHHKKYLEDRNLTNTDIYHKICSRLQLMHYK